MAQVAAERQVDSNTQQYDQSVVTSNIEASIESYAESLIEALVQSHTQLENLNFTQTVQELMKTTKVLYVQNTQKISLNLSNRAENSALHKFFGEIQTISARYVLNFPEHKSFIRATIESAITDYLPHGKNAAKISAFREQLIQLKA